jgi:FkbM family methyltransferase
VIEIARRIGRSVRARALKMVLSPFRPKTLTFKQVTYRGGKFVVMANEDIGWRLISKRGFEELELSCIERLIRDDDVCLDIGANIGIYTVFMAKKASKGRVFAFEPVPVNRSVMTLNVLLNELCNVEIKDFALSDSSGAVKFSVAEDGAYCSIRATDRKRELRSVLVNAATLDEVFAHGKVKVDIVKIDVEGAELLVLKGGQRLLADPALRPRALLVELSAENSDKYGYSVEDVIRFMGSLEYQFSSVGRTGLQKVGVRSRQSLSGLFLLKET